MLSTIQAAVHRLQVLLLSPGPHGQQILLLPPRPQHLSSTLLYGPQTFIGGGFGHQELSSHPQALVGSVLQSLSGLQPLGGGLSGLQTLIGGGFGRQELSSNHQALVGSALQSLLGVQALGGALFGLQALGGSRLQARPPYNHSVAGPQVASSGPPQHPQANC